MLILVHGPKKTCSKEQSLNQILGHRGKRTQEATCITQFRKQWWTRQHLIQHLVPTRWCTLVVRKNSPGITFSPTKNLVHARTAATLEHSSQALPLFYFSRLLSAKGYHYHWPAPRSKIPRWGYLKCPNEKSHISVQKKIIIKTSLLWNNFHNA